MQHPPSDAANAYPVGHPEGSVGSGATDVHDEGTSQTSHNYSGADGLVPVPAGLANMTETFLGANAGAGCYPSECSRSPYMYNWTAGGQYSRNMYQEGEIVSLASTLPNSTDVNPHPPYHDETKVGLDDILGIDWSVWGIMDGPGYPQGGHSSTSAPELPHNVHAATAPGMRGYPPVTLPPFGVVAPNHRLPGATGVVDKPWARPGTSAGGVGGQDPCAAPPVTPPSSVVGSSVGNIYMVNGGRLIGTTNGENPDVAIGRAQISQAVASPEASRHRMQGGPRWSVASRYSSKALLSRHSRHK